MDFLLTSSHKLRFSTEFRNRLETLNDLPALPETARAMMRFRNNPAADIADIVAVIEQDPAIALQVLAYARSAAFGYGDRIKSVGDAVSVVLGFERTLNMVMGFVAGQLLTMAADGPLGRSLVWQHSVYTAALMESLARKIPADMHVDPGLAYLGGLFHDIGFMLLGHLYPYEFSVLNSLVAKYQDVETRELELLCLGVSHDMSGMWLMRAWDMPEELSVAVGEHYFPDFDGKYSAYSKLTNLANQLLKDISDPRCVLGELKYFADFAQFSLTEEDVNAALTQIKSSSKGLDELAASFAV